MSPAVGLALGAIAVTGIVTAATSTALALRVPADVSVATARTPEPRPGRDPVQDVEQDN